MRQAGTAQRAIAADAEGPNGERFALVYGRTVRQNRVALDNALLLVESGTVCEGQSRTVSMPPWVVSSGRIGALVAGLLALHCVALQTAVAAQEGSTGPIPAVFMKLEGQWKGEGNLLGRPAEFVMRWETEPQGFVRLTFSNAWVGKDGSQTPVLSSEATYLPRGSSALGVWLDDRPQRLTLRAALTDSTVITNWTADAEEGRTEYVVRSPEEVVVRDIVYVDGSDRLFAEATYRRPLSPSGQP